MSTITVFAPQLKPGDLVVDPSGDYAQYGPITRVRRQGVSFVAETRAGVNLSFGVTNRVQIQR